MVSSTDSQSMDNVLEDDLEETLTLDQMVETYQDNNSHVCTEFDSIHIHPNDFFIGE